ncbi:hypothetical protein TIFTF001_028166 [Ficus carica]|uniref:Retrotransposon gag domain-containing protein n=1 Tax=Ficus carica TaxID=3494 RepID=A0AA88DPX9_FICCA|nr:hypothetical protein TIFTF001_028166 [Ficus carica]
MPSMASYDGSSDADEHLENYRAYMQIQSANEAALCKSFCLTLTGAARQWYRRLAPRSISSFQQLRFDKAVVQAESCTDETLIQAFREGIQDPCLVWTLAYDKPPTFAQLRGITWRKSDRNQSDGGKAPATSSREEPRSSPKTPAGKFHQYTPLVMTVENVLYQVSGKGLLRDPRPIRTDQTRRNPNKYCHFHKDVGHETKDCIQLRDQIEALIRDSHLREFVERIITPAEPSNRPAQGTRRNQRPDDQPDEPGPEHIVHTIFGGTATGDTASSQRSYARESRRFARGEFINITEHVSKICCQRSTPITFTDVEADRLLHPHNNALVGEIRVADNVIQRVLIDNGSSADVMFMDAFSRLKIGGAVLTPIQTPLYGFAGECVRAANTVNLPIAIGDGPERVTRMVEFIVVDRPSAYNVILGRPILNAIKAVVSTYHLAMKFPTEGGIGVFRGNQEGARKCYVEAVNRVGQRTAAPITVAAIFRINEIEAPSEEVKRFSDLDPCTPEEEVQTYPAEELIPYQLDPEHPERTKLEADAFARLASGSDTEGLVYFPIERLEQPSIDRAKEVLFFENTKTWMDPIHRYLTYAEHPEERVEARRIKNTSARSINPLGPWTPESGPQVVRRPEMVEPDQDT